MSSGAKAQERLTQAIFSVCGDDAVVQTATAAALKAPGAQFAGEFRDYIVAGRKPQFSPQLREAASCVALVDFDRDAEAALETVERLRRSFTNQKSISIIAVAARMEAGLLLRAMRNGCSEFLIKPVNPDELASALIRFSAGVAAAPRTQITSGKLVALCGAKGGVGTTMLAVHLATHLALQHGGRTLLVDLKPQLGHVALFLGLRDTQYYFEELLRNADRLDSGVLNGLVVHHKSGLDVIASPEVSGGTAAQTEQLAAVFDFLRHQYDYVLLDSAALHDAHSPVVEQAGEIYIVSTPDIASLRDLARLVERLSVSESSSGKLRIVVNRSTSTDAVGAEQIEKAVRFPISVSVPNNYVELLRAINDGEPIPPQRRSEFNLALARWAGQIAGGATAPETLPEKKGLFSFLR